VRFVCRAVDDKEDRRAELKRNTVELETEISLTNPLILQLEGMLTRRRDSVKVNNQNSFADEMYRMGAANFGSTYQPWKEEMTYRPEGHVADNSVVSMRSSLQVNSPTDHK
jgi:hypothetical protein